MGKTAACGKIPMKEEKTAHGNAGYNFSQKQNKANTLIKSMIKFGYSKKNHYL